MVGAQKSNASKEELIRVASDRGTKPDVLEALSKNDDRDVRAAVAGNTSAALSPTLDRLRWDPDPQIKIAATRTMNEKVAQWLRDFDLRRIDEGNRDA